MGRRIRKFLQLSGTDRGQLVRAWLLLAVYVLAIRLLPFKSINPSVNPGAVDIYETSLTRQQQALARNTGSLVKIAARWTPWYSSCLAQALVTRRLLVGLDVPGFFQLGVRRDPAGEGLLAHAWVTCGDEVVNGGAGSEDFTSLRRFHWGAAESGS